MVQRRFPGSVRLFEICTMTDQQSYHFMAAFHKCWRKKFRFVTVWILLQPVEGNIATIISRADMFECSILYLDSPRFRDSLHCPFRPRVQSSSSSPISSIRQGFYFSKLPYFVWDRRQITDRHPVEACLDMRFGWIRIEASISPAAHYENCS